MGLNYHNLKKHRRNFLDITGFFLGSIFFKSRQIFALCNLNKQPKNLCVM
ncbi:hypothetical protein IYZ83_002980 [Wolbachia pipientis]|nr:hypothetical protein [Wolbachia pipientis]UIP92153.1 hypothetical protein IYZ83_002980 [Wolbachia pipientis]